MIAPKRIMYSCRGGMLTMVAYHNAVEQSGNATEYSNQMFEGYNIYKNVNTRHHNKSRGMRRTMRTLAPKACGGKLDLNFDFTTPLLPCGRVTRLQNHQRWRNAWRPKRPYPQITRTFDPAICRLARYTYATRCANAII